MSSSKLISAEQLTAYERWELPSVGRQRASVEALESQLPQPPTAEEIEAIQQEAWQEGFEQGRQEGLQAGQQLIDEAVARLSQMFDALAEPLAAVDERVEEELLQLALSLARQVVYRELQSDPNEIIGVVREAIRALPSSHGHLRIQVNPEDAALLREHLHTEVDEHANWSLVEDPALSRGGCRASSEQSQVDATLESRIDALATRLMGGRRGSDQHSE